MKILNIFLLTLIFTAGFLRMADDGDRSPLTPANSSSSGIRPEMDALGRFESGFALQALEWQYRLRAHPAGRIPEGWREAAMTQSAALKGGAPGEALSALTWISLGPTDVGGRIRSIAIDPNDPSIVYCGSVSGGVWKSTDAGGSWFPTNDLAANLVIGALAIDPNNPNIIYAGTGEGYFNVDALRGAGILKSTDGGATWALTTTFSSSPSGFPYYINDIYIRPDDSRLLYAATNSGVYRSTNSGASWIYIPKTTGTRRATQIVADPLAPATFYVAYGNFTTDGVYKTTDGGASFTKLTGGFPTTGFERIALAICKGTPSVLYAVLCASSTYGTHSIQKTTDGGASWTAVNAPTDAYFGGTHLGNQGWYNNVVAVHPSDPNLVYVGGINSFRSTSGGMTWTQMSHGGPAAIPFMHVDQHAIAFQPGNPAVMYFGNDGGMYKTTNGGTTIGRINNGLAVTQFYSGAAHPSAEIFYGGTQDNGTLMSVSQPAWTTSLGGDGGHTAVDFTTPTTVYTEYVYLNFQKSLNSGATWFRSMSGIPVSGGAQSDGTSDRCAFIAPFAMDPSNSQVLVAGTYRVYRTTNGAGMWTPISPDLTGDAGGAGGVGSQLSVITALAVAPSTQATIWAGTSGGDSAARVQVTTNTGSSWVNVTKSPLPNRAVTSIAVDPTNSQRAYVGYSGYNTNTPTTPGHVFRTTNRGTTWTNVSANLPDVPVNAVILNPVNPEMHIIVGTDLGMYQTTDGGTSWTEENTGLAKVSVFDLDLRPDGIVVAATHGRGMFRTAASITPVGEETTGIPAAHRLLQNYPNPFNPSTTIAFELAGEAEVGLRVYDAAGREVATLAAGRLGPGAHTRSFDGAGLASGVYFAALEVRAPGGADFRDVRKMMLIR